jgi:hypothetical protein
VYNIGHEIIFQVMINENSRQISVITKGIVNDRAIPPNGKIVHW